MNHRAWHNVLWMGALTALLGCSSTATIGAVTAAPGDFQNREVTLKGTVTDHVAVPFVQRSLYRMQDDTGTIWVLGLGEAPERNQTRTVRGTVEKGLTVGTRTFGVLLKETASR